jgi:toxin ParE1/3/4
MSAPKLTLVLAPRAQRDFRSILLYTLQQWGSAQRDAYGAELGRAFESLTHSPQIGRARDEVSPGLRSFQVRQHVIYYRFTGGALKVIRILHERMDARRYLGQLP